MDQQEIGLSVSEVKERLNRDGYNEIPSQKQQNVFVIFLEVVCEPMFLLLLASGLIYFFLGEIRDAMMLATFVFVVIGITFYQKRKTERAVEALKNLASPRALVIRDGERRRVAGREVVVGDLLVLMEGDRIPADAVIISATNLLVDESLLTGESIAVWKSEDAPLVFSGTMVVQGHGMAKVIATGIKTEMGKIGKSLLTITEEDSLLKKETGLIIRNFAIAGLILCLIVIVVYGMTRGDWLQGFLAGLTLSMAMLPEEFSVVFLVFLTLGAWRISKRQVLTRRTGAIENLGAVTTLCVDKTGTLTLNNLTLQGFMIDKQYQEISKISKDLPEKYHRLFEYGILASQRDPFDPLEKEIKNKGEEFLKGSEHIHKDWRLVKEYPLSKELFALSHVFKSPDSNNYVIAAKGAPEAIADLCHFSKIQQEDLMKNIKLMSNKGLRVIGVAKALFSKKNLPNIQHDFPFEFVGLLGFVDPVRSSVPQSISKCYTAGVRVIMITGDYPGTAQYVAEQIGLKNKDEFISGQELGEMDEKTLREKIKTVNIFARVVPEQKLLIVNALKANGEIVAMTGDGVNDTPALKSAHIGIAMGERGTDVARETADLILLNDDFSSIVETIRLGRRIFDNLKKAMAYIFAVHIPIAGMSLLPIIFKLPIVLYPAHIAFLELIIDPACSIVFESEKEEKDVMNRPPRNLNLPLFGKKTFLKSLLQGVTILIGVFLIFLLSKSRSLVFISLVITNLILIIVNLSQSNNTIDVIKEKNKSLYWVIGLTLIFLFVIFYFPFLKDLFHF